MAAAELALTSRLQLWDAVVCVTAFRAGARTLLSEDMQDGGLISGLRIINPFNPANTALLRDLVGEGPQ